MKKRIIQFSLLSLALSLISCSQDDDNPSTISSEPVCNDTIQSTILTDGKSEIERLTATAKVQIGTIEARVRKQISDYVATLALQRITTQLEGKLNSSLQQQIIDRNISKLAE